MLQSVPEWKRNKVDWSEKRRFFYFNRLPWQRPMRNQKIGPDRSYSNKYISSGAKIAKIGPVDPEIIVCCHKKKEIRNAWQKNS